MSELPCGWGGMNPLAGGLEGYCPNSQSMQFFTSPNMFPGSYPPGGKPSDDPGFEVPVPSAPPMFLPDG